MGLDGKPDGVVWVGNSIFRRVFSREEPPRTRALSINQVPKRARMQMAAPRPLQNVHLSDKRRARIATASPAQYRLQSGK